jgi:surfeit locus 1 family protein
VRVRRNGSSVGGVRSLVAVPESRDARFLLSPRWVLSHVLVVLAIVVMVNLGFWQLRRLEEKRDRNALIESRMDQPIVPVEELVAPGDGDGEVAAARFRRVIATGTYDVDATIVVRNRTLDGASGAWLVTPLVLDGGDRVGVLRGFVGFLPDGEVVDAPAPSGEVAVEGLVVDPDSFDGTAPGDLDPLLAGADVAPGIVLAGSSTPPEPLSPDAAGKGRDEGTILAVPPPELSEGPHLGYAAQWFIFSTIALVGYPLVLRRVVARRGKEVDDEDAAGGPGDDPDAELADLLRHGG